MTEGRAVGIISDLKNDAYTYAEKCEAIIVVSQMKNPKPVKKAALVDGLAFMAELAKNLLEELENERKGNG